MQLHSSTSPVRFGQYTPRQETFFTDPESRVLSRDEVDAFEQGTSPEAAESMAARVFGHWPQPQIMLHFKESEAAEKLVQLLENPYITDEDRQTLETLLTKVFKNMDSPTEAQSIRKIIGDTPAYTPSDVVVARLIEGKTRTEQEQWDYIAALEAEQRGLTGIERQPRPKDDGFRYE